jgi:hypothetical protein
MYEVVIKGFKTKAQAEVFIQAYEGQGEQTAWIWYEDRKLEGIIDVESMNVNCRETYPLTWEDNQVTMVVDPR